MGTPSEISEMKAAAEKLEAEGRRVLNGVKAAITEYGGEIDTERPDGLTYFYPLGPRLPWTADMQSGWLTLSQKLAGVPNDPELLKLIRGAASTPKTTIDIRLTPKDQSDGRRTWLLEVERRLSIDELTTHISIRDAVFEPWTEHTALLSFLQEQRPDLMGHLKPVVRTRSAAAQQGTAQPNAAPGREPTEAEMLGAMRNHLAARIGKGSFTLAGVDKVSSRRIAANQYRIVYVPHMKAEGDSLISWLVALTPNSQNTATFTYANGAWHFSGAE